MAKIEVGSKLDPSGFQSGLDQMKNAAAGMASQMGGIGGTISRIFSPSGGIIAGITAAVAGIGALAKSGLSYGHELHEMSIESGVSSEAMQRWSRTATLNGGSAEKMSLAFFKLRDAQSQVVDGDKNMIKAFSELGMSADEVAGTDLDSLMLRVAEALTQGNNAGTAFHATADILGKRTLPTLVGTLNAAAQGVEEFGKRSTDMTDAQIVRLDMLSEKWKSLKDTIKSAAGGILATVLGISSSEVQERVEAEKNMRDAAKETNREQLEQSRQEKIEKGLAPLYEKASELKKERDEQLIKFESERKQAPEGTRISGFGTAGIDSARKMGGIAGIGGSTFDVYAVESARRQVALAEKILEVDQKQQEVVSKIDAKISELDRKMAQVVSGVDTLAGI